MNDPQRFAASYPGSDQFQPLPAAYSVAPAPLPRRRIVVTVLMFVATCLSTYLTGGLVFAITLMFILTTHELGHFFQALRYHVPASFPYFIPMPLSPIGTMGA